MRVPSWDTAGFESGAGSFVSCVCPLPSAFMMKISGLPVRSLVKAIFEPSPDQLGKPLNLPWVVSRRSFEPSASITITAEVSLATRLRVKAIFVPSGEYAAWPSARLAPLVSRRWLVPSAFMAQMSPGSAFFFRTRPARVKAIVVPSGEKVGSTSIVTPLVSCLLTGPVRRS